MSEGAVARLENGEAPDDWTLRQLDSLAAALGFEVAELLAQPDRGDASEDDDIAVVGSLLIRFSRLTPTRALAHATNWELARVNRAIRALDQAVRPAGLRVQRLRGAVAIRPGPLPVDDERLARLLQREIARTKLSLSQLEMLAAAADGTVDEQRFSEADRVTYASLMNAGLLEESGGVPALTAAAEVCLRPERDLRV